MFLFLLLLFVLRIKSQDSSSLGSYTIPDDYGPVFTDSLHSL